VRRVSQISEPEDFNVEAKREALRERRSRRRQRMLFSAASSIAVVLVALRAGARVPILPLMLELAVRGF
jgi:hypothetical protein